MGSSNTMRRLQQKKFDMKKYIFFKRRHRRHLYRRRLYTVQLVERTTFLSSCDETLEGKGENYNGCQNKSISGRRCQSWITQYPHRHDDGLWLEKNFCRNLEGKKETIW